MPTMLTELWADLRSRLRAIFFRETVERELEAELRFHIERETEKNIGNGMSRDDAERAARRARRDLPRSCCARCALRSSRPPTASAVHDRRRCDAGARRGRQRGDVRD